MLITIYLFPLILFILILSIPFITLYVIISPIFKYLYKNSYYKKNLDKRRKQLKETHLKEVIELMHN